MMSQIADIQVDSLRGVLEKLRQQAQILPPSPTSIRYLRALQSFKSSLSGRGDSSDLSDLSGLSDSSALQNALRGALGDWLVSQWMLKASFSTASLYLDIISSLYGAAVKAGELPATKLFSELKVELKEIGADGWRKGIDDEIFARALRLTKNAHRLLLDDSIAADLAILSLTHNLLPIQTLAQLKRADLEEKSEESDRSERSDKSEKSDRSDPSDKSDLSALSEKSEILTRISARHLNGNARRKYIFPLRQSERTPLQLKKHLFKITNALFRRARLPQSTDPNQTIEALWAYAALRTGLPGSAIVSHLGHAPLGLPILKLSNGRAVSNRPAPSAVPNSAASLSSGVSEIAASLSTGVSKIAASLSMGVSKSAASLSSGDTRYPAIGQIFLENPPHWYAMQLRPGVRFTQICRRIQQLSDLLPDIQLFYPCEEIARAIGKKIVVKQRPFIHSVVFFRAKLTDIGLLFARIGDLAWCYRQSARPGAPYADITQKQFERFQQTIAQFTPDYEVASTGELELKKNDRVQIVGGLFAGQEATFDSIVAPSTPTASPTDMSQTDATASSTVYRLNIVGENGIEWRINVDPRVIKPN